MSSIIFYHHYHHHVIKFCLFSSRPVLLNSSAEATKYELFHHPVKVYQYHIFALAGQVAIALYARSPDRVKRGYW